MLLVIIYVLFCLYLFFSEDELIIVTSHYKENLDWLEGHKVVVCDKEGSDPINIKSYGKYSCPPTVNTGHEATSYLNFIINNYDNLPKYVAFIHGHERAWHQENDIFDIIKRKDYINKNYVSLNSVSEIEPPPAALKFIKDNWETYFKDIGKLPDSFKTIPCSQFITNRESLLKIPKSSYEKMLELTMIPELNKRGDDLFIGNVLEYIFPLLCGERN